MWKNEPGEELRTNWFKDHPYLTLAVLGGCIVLIVIVTI
jgi:hypothetical protein